MLDFMRHALQEVNLTQMANWSASLLRSMELLKVTVRDFPYFSTPYILMDKLSLRFAHAGRLSTALTSLIFCGAALAADASATLSIQVRGFANERGHAVANLFREGDDVLKPDKAYRRVQAEIHDGKATINFPDLAYGKYAVSVFHDENGNGKLDHNFLKIPAEPLGFSNNFHLGLFSGFPSFEKLQFPFSADTGVLEITLE